MKKKLLTILLSVFVMMGAFTTNVFAAGDEAKIGSTPYATLQEAINAVNNGEEIIVIDDITCGTPITINNGKSFTINFNDGSTQHSFKWDVTTGSTIDQDIFTIGSNSNVTVKNMEFLVGGTDEQGNRIFTVNATGTLTLSQMTSIDGNGKRNIPVLNNGGTVTIDGGTITTDSTNTTLISPNGLNPIVQNLGGTTTITGNGTYTTQNSTGAVWLGNVITTADPSADPNNDCGNVTIENGIFNTGQIICVNGKGNIIINDASCSSTLTVIKVWHGGVKSKITIENIIANSNQMFAQVLANLETKIDFQNGEVKYYPGRFCMNGSGGTMESISIKNGKFGPSSGSTDIHDEVDNLLAAGATLTAISESGYTYKVETVTPPPTPPTPPTPPAPTPDPDPDPEPTPAYVIPNTSVEGTPTNNHSLLKLSTLSLLTIGTYMVIKKKKDN